MKYFVGAIGVVWTLILTGIPLAIAYALNHYVDLPTLLAVFSWIVAAAVSTLYLVIGGIASLVAAVTADETSRANRRRGPLR